MSLSFLLLSLLSPCFLGPVNTEKGQEDLGVVWLGDAGVKASKGALRAGVHRVVYPQVAQPRIAAWYEMCTVDQLNQDRLEYPGIFFYAFLPLLFPFFLLFSFFSPFIPPPPPPPPPSCFPPLLFDDLQVQCPKRELCNCQICLDLLQSIWMVT